MKRETVCVLPIEERFARDIANHQMEIRHEDGIYRHVVFKRPDTVCMMFALTTTPGRLVYSGDMGCFVFERLPDMFEFFRTDRAPNMGYWHQKLVAIDRDQGSMEHNVDQFRDNLESYDTDELTDEQKQAVSDFIDDACSKFEDDGPAVAYQAVNDFELEDAPKYCRDFFSDFFERSDMVFTLRFEWACYAISWAIKTFDEFKQSEVLQCHRES
jgi:hypothetical protein